MHRDRPQVAAPRSFWGWGAAGRAADPRLLHSSIERLSALFDRSLDPVDPPRASDLRLPPPRIEPPATLTHLGSTQPVDRARHSYGRSYRDVVRGLAGHFPAPPDLVVRPGNEDDVVAVLDWCTGANIAVVPYGGGSSVVGGVESDVTGHHRGVISLDLERLARVIDIDRTSRAARVQGGILGPALEDALRPDGLTLRHYPQSFEFSTLGGWIATRSAGHFSTRTTHIDDAVEAVRLVTPAGPIETRRLPASGAGPSPDRLVTGSEGAFGVITEAWVRLRRRPEHRSSATFEFPAGFLAGATAVRMLAASGLDPATCRLLDPLEALIAGTGRGDSAVLLVGFESADHDVEPWLERASRMCRAAGGSPADSGRQTGEGGAAGRWRRAFLEAPYLRDDLIRHGVLVETFETAITWDRFDPLHSAVMEATAAAVNDVCGTGVVTTRITHAYPDGAAPYYTVVAPARRGSELRQWAVVKEAAAEAILAGGGTITHHHAVGRDHRPWYDRQRPALFADALRAVKRRLDPAWIMNPGVLLDETADR